MSTQQGLSCSTRSQKPMISISVTRESAIGNLHSCGDNNKNKKPMQGERSVIGQKTSDPTELSSKSNQENKISNNNVKPDVHLAGCVTTESTKISLGHTPGLNRLAVQNQAARPNDCSVTLPNPIPARIVHIAPPLRQQIVKTTGQTGTIPSKPRKTNVPSFQHFANQASYSVLNKPVSSLPGNYLTNKTPVRFLVPVQGPVFINQSEHNQMRNGNNIMRFAPPQTDRIHTMKSLPVRPASSAGPQIVYVPSHTVPFSPASIGGQLAAPFSPELKSQNCVSASIPEVRNYPRSLCVSECHLSPLPLYHEPHHKDDCKQIRPQVATLPKFTLAGNQPSTVSSASYNTFKNLAGCPEQQVRPGFHFYPSYNNAQRGQIATTTQESAFNRKPTRMSDVDESMKEIISDYIHRCRLAESNNSDIGNENVQTSPLDLSMIGESNHNAVSEKNKVTELGKTNCNISIHSLSKTVTTNTSSLDSNCKSQPTVATVDNTNTDIAKQNISPNPVKSTELKHHISTATGDTALRNSSVEAGRVKCEETNSVKSGHPEEIAPFTRLVNGGSIKHESQDTSTERLSTTNALPKQQSSINRTEKEIKSECMSDMKDVSFPTQIPQQEANTTTRNALHDNRIKSENIQKNLTESLHAEQTKDKEAPCVEEEESTAQTDNILPVTYEQLCEKLPYTGRLHPDGTPADSPPLPGYVSVVVLKDKKHFDRAQASDGCKTPIPDSASERERNAKYIKCISGHEIPLEQGSENTFDNHMYHRNNPVLELSADSPISVDCLEPHKLHSVPFLEQDFSMHSDHGELMGIDPEKFTKDTMFLTQPAKDLRWSVTDLMWDMDGIFNDPNGYGFDSFKIARRYHISIAKSLASISTLIDSIVKLIEFQNKNKSDLNFWSYDSNCFPEFIQDLKELMMNNVQGFNKISNHMQRLAEEGLVLTRNIYPNSKFVPEQLSSLVTKSWYHDPDEFVCLTGLFPENLPGTDENLLAASPVKTGQDKRKQQELAENGAEPNKQEDVIKEQSKPDKIRTTDCSVDSGANCVDDRSRCQGKPKVTCYQTRDPPRESSSRHTSRSPSKDIKENSICSSERRRQSPNKSSSSVRESRSRSHNSRSESTKSTENYHDGPKHSRRGRPRKTESHTDNQPNISRERRPRIFARMGSPDHGPASRDRKTRSRSRDKERYPDRKRPTGKRTRSRYVEKQRGYGDVSACQNKTRERRQKRGRPRKLKSSQEQSEGHLLTNEIQNVSVCLQNLDPSKIKMMTEKLVTRNDKSLNLKAIDKNLTPPKNSENTNLSGRDLSSRDPSAHQSPCFEEEFSGIDIASKGEWIVVDELNTSNSANVDNSSQVSPHGMSLFTEHRDQGRSEESLAILKNQSQAGQSTAGIDHDISQSGHTTKTDQAKATTKLDNNSDKAKATTNHDKVHDSELHQDYEKKIAKHEKPRVRHPRKRKMPVDPEDSTRNKQNKLENISAEQSNFVSQKSSESVEVPCTKHKYPLSILEKLASVRMMDGTESEVVSSPSQRVREKRGTDVYSDNAKTTYDHQDNDLYNDRKSLFAKSRQTTFIKESSASGPMNEMDSPSNISPQCIKNLGSKKKGDASKMSFDPPPSVSAKSAKSYKGKGKNKSKRTKKQIELDDSSERVVDNAIKPLGRPVSPQEVIGPVKKRGFQNKQECFEILDVVYNTDIHDYFTHEIKSRDVPDYYKIVKYPMCLDVVAQRIRQGLYADLGSFVHDMRRIFWNCRLYYQNDNRILDDCTRVESFFENKLTKTFPNVDFSAIHGSPKYQKTLESPREKDNPKSRSSKTKKFNIPRELRELFG